MQHFLEIRNYFNEKQYGFIKGRSTVLQLTYFGRLDFGKQIDVIYTAFEKLLIKYRTRC